MAVNLRVSVTCAGIIVGTVIVAVNLRVSLTCAGIIVGTVIITFLINNNNIFAPSPACLTNVAEQTYNYLQVLE